MEIACHHQHYHHSPAGSASPECALSPYHWTGQARSQPPVPPPTGPRPAGDGGTDSSFPPPPTHGHGRAQLPALVGGEGRPSSSPGRSAQGPLHSQECGLIVQGRGDTGAEGASALDTVGAGLLNRLGDCLLTMGSEEQERFGWTGASWEGSPWSKAQAVSLWAENIHC